MEIIESNSKDAAAFLAAHPPAEGFTRYYHGSSKYFLPRVQEHGFRPEFRLLTDEQLGAVHKWGNQMRSLGADGLWSLTLSKRLNLATDSPLAIGYAAGNLKGGIYRFLYNDLANMLNDQPEQLGAEEAILTGLYKELGLIFAAPGILYAVDFDHMHVARLTNVEYGCAHAPFDILPDRITYALIIPAES